MELLEARGAGLCQRDAGEASRRGSRRRSATGSTTRAIAPRSSSRRCRKQSAPWSFETYRCAAEALGRFNGAYLAGRPRPDFPWMLPGRVGNWLGLSGDAIARLRKEADEPVLRAWLSEGTLDRTLELWRRRDELLAALRLAAGMPLPPRRLPPQPDRARRPRRGRRVRRHRLVHARPRGGGRGSRATGRGLAAVHGRGHGRGPRFRARGLRGLPCRAPERRLEPDRPRSARLGFTASTSLLLGLGAFGVWLPYLRDPASAPVIERVIGKPMGAFLGRLARLQSYAHGSRRRSPLTRCRLRTFRWAQRCLRTGTLRGDRGRSGHDANAGRRRVDEFRCTSKTNASAHARWRCRVKYNSKYIYQIGESKVKRRLRHISWRIFLR